MKISKNVHSTHKPKNVEFDGVHVYVSSEVEEIEVDGETQYSYTETEYDKDEFLCALSTGQLSLNDKTTALEDMVLEMSQIVYA